jgi:hypothetical protein
MAQNKKKKKVKKEQMWIVRSNADLSYTVPLLSTAKELIEADFEDLDLKGQQGIEYTISPVWLTEKQIIKKIGEGD